MVPRDGRGRYLDCPRSVPWDVIVPHESQAKRNHGGQSLERLAERGGLSPREFVAVVTNRSYREIERLNTTDEEAVEFVKRCVTEPEWTKGGA